MRSLQKYLSAGLLLLASVSYAQRGKDGNKTVNTANSIVNEYTALTANASAGSTSLTVTSSDLNANNRFAGTLSPGDLIMIIQMQGATILGQPDAFTPTISNPNDATWGAITNYNNCGNYELCEVNSVPDNTTITIDCGLTKSYTVSGKVQVIRVPRYNSLTITSPGVLTCSAWNGTTGGVLAVEVLGNTTINTGAKVSATGTGFRGGALFTTSGGPVSTVLYSCASLNVGTNKGEGIAGYDTDYTPYGGKYCRGAAANAGGGGNYWNCGGGGGGNAGNIATWTGQGNPDNSIAGWVTAWNLESASFSTSTSSGGGRGGYSFSDQNKNATTLGPGTVGVTNTWGGAYRYNLGGLGGRPLDYSTGKLFLGGGGGAGDQDNNQGGAGGAGGGIIYFMSYSTITGSGNDSIISNGNNGGNSKNTGTNAGKDAGGGAGGGGTIIFNSVGNVSGIAIQANGGTGGNQLVNTNPFYPLGEAEGPGGGGGGGYIAVSNGTPSQQALGGGNGITQSPHLTEFLPNGATSGGTGLINQSISNFTFSANDTAICSGNTATLTVTTTGTVPGGTVITWYSSQTGGSSIGTGSPFTTPVLTGTTIYYVGTCPGNYRIPVTVTVISSLTPTINGAATICPGQAVTLTASGGGTYSWNTGATTTAITVSPIVTSTYTVTATSGGCTGTATVEVTVGSSSLPTITGTTTICSGNSTTLTANAGGTYSWSTGETTASITVSPVVPTSYSVTVSNGGCTGSATAQIAVTSTPVPTISGTTTICPGQGTTLTASGGGTYSWNTGATTTAITVSPIVTSTYTVTATSGGCTGTATVEVIVASSLLPTITGTTTICNGNGTILTANAGGTYSWSTGETTTSITVSPITPTSYSVTVTNGGCTGSATVQVAVTSTPVPTISGTTTICSGQGTTLTAGGGGTYSWSTGATTTTITISPVSTNTYTVTTSSGSCTGTATVQVIVTSAPIPTISGTTAICPGQGATLTASGGGSYSWSTSATTSAITVSPGSTSTYTVIVTTSGCSGSATVEVMVTVGFVPSISGATSVCNGTSVTLSTNGGSTYSWNNGSTTSSITVTPSITTTYTVTVMNGSCSGTASQQVIVDANPVPLISGTTTLCSGDSTTLTASGGGTYSWSPGAYTTAAITITPTVTSTYTITVTNGTCSNSATQEVKVTSLVAPAISGNNNVCRGKTVILTASAGASYSWNTSETSTSISVSPVSTTTYTVTASIGLCTGTASHIVRVDTLPVITISPDVTITYGNSTTLSVSGGGTYSWTPIAGLSCTGCANPTASPTQTTQYCVVVTNSAGCSDNACVTVTVNLLCGEVFVPNAFSPNNDGENDLECVFGKCVETMTFVIFDRWGEKVFESSDPKICWDGNYKGKAMNTAVFVYYLDATLVTGEQIKKKGNISLVR